MPPLDISLPGDPEAAAAKQYIALRRCARETFHLFLRNINSQSLRFLEQQFEQSGGTLRWSDFQHIFTKVFPRPISNEITSAEDHRFIIRFAVQTLFDGIDVDLSGEVSWMKFVEYICAVAEEVRVRSQDTGQSFDFHHSTISVPFKPANAKCHFDKIFYWPEHPFESALIFEEHQTSFHLHRPSTMARRRTVDGHQAELLAAVFMSAPFEWVVTSGNDRMVCFWDSAFNLVKRWTLDHIVGSMCWCPGVNALYHADHFRPLVRVWRIGETLDVRGSEAPLRPDKTLELHSSHTKPVQAMVWLSSLQTLATASLDTTVQLFDLVQHKCTHVLAGHSKGLTCLMYIPEAQMLLSSGFDTFICIWDPSAGTMSHKLHNDTCGIVSICQVPDTDFEFLSIDVEGVVKVWDVRQLLCVQSFHTVDLRAQRAGEVETLDPRAICPLSRDRVLVSGRRMLMIERDSSDPKLTADLPIHAIEFNHRKMEILTPVENNIYVWCALTGTILTTHTAVTDRNITALKLDKADRRILVGADNGVVNAINHDSGALIKRFNRHALEVSQIECIPGKVLTHSTLERQIYIHDDRDPKKAVVLKKINLTDASGAILRFSHDGRDVIIGGSEEGEVLWYHMDFGKVVGNSARSEVQHSQAVSCCQYLQDVPLIVTADAESNFIFWSVPPLRTYDFFSKVEVCFGSDGNQASQAGGTTVAAGMHGITSLAFSWPQEEQMIVGTERGALACVCVRPVVESARRLQEEILSVRDSVETREAGPGRVFPSVPKRELAEHTYTLRPTWMVKNAHPDVRQVMVCKQTPSVIFTLGDTCVRIWSLEGEALGTLEQGRPEGLPYQRQTTWRFPIDVSAQPPPLEAPPAAKSSLKRKPSDPMRKTTPAGPPRRLSSNGCSAPDLLALEGPRRTSANSRSSSGTGKRGLGRNRRPFTSPAPTQDWLVGLTGHKPGVGGRSLPQLQSGLKRVPMSENKQVVEAACRLSSALGACW